MTIDEVQLEHRLTRVEAACDAIPSMQATLEDISRKFAKYEGKWGTITLIAAGLWAAAVTFKDDILNFIKGN